jgi:hypothetical protein
MTKKSGGEETVNHYGLVRLRVNGAAQLRMTLFSLDRIISNVLVPVPLKSQTYLEPTRLSNMTQQRAKLQITTTGLGEYFRISKIVIFVKPVAKSWPSTE